MSANFSLYHSPGVSWEAHVTTHFFSEALLDPLVRLAPLYREAPLRRNHSQAELFERRQTQQDSILGLSEDSPAAQRVPIKTAPVSASVRVHRR